MAAQARRVMGAPRLRQTWPNRLPADGFSVSGGAWRAANRLKHMLEIPAGRHFRDLCL